MEPRKQIDDEVLSRTRRIETRLTQLMLAMGVDTQAQKPIFMRAEPETNARVVIPSRHTSMKEVLDTVPKSCDGPVELFVGDKHVATLTSGVAATA